MDGLEAPAFGATFLLGLFGSVHCLGMCGGIAAALSQRGSGTHSFGSAITEPILYNTARITSYAMVGAIAGGFGQGLGWLIGPAFVTGTRVVLGLWFVALGLQLSGVCRPFARLEKFGLAVWRRLAPVAKRFDRFGPRARSMLLGAIWGWLPCGLVYAAAVGAAVTGSAAQGAALMFAFGLGTLPLMIASGIAADGLAGWANARHARRAAAVLLVTAGIWTMVGAMPMAGQGAHRHPSDPTDHADHGAHLAGDG